MKLTCRSLLALFACVILCTTNGCAGISGISARSDNHGGVVVYETEGAYPRAVARVDSDGQKFYAAPKPGEIQRGAGGVDVVSENLTAGQYCGPSDTEFWLAFTVVYLIVLLIEVIIAAVD
jgi:hypothetical protein